MLRAAASQVSRAPPGGCGSPRQRQHLVSHVDRYPDAAAKAAADEAFQRLAKLTPGAAGAERDNYFPDALPFLRFEVHEAQPAVDAWRADLERRLRAGNLHPAVESHLAKYRSLIPSLALILHLLDGGVGPVSLAATERAIRWGQYLASHARRVYACVTDAPAVAARLLAARITARDVTGPFAARDVYRMGWSGLDRDQTASAIDVLLSLRWLEERSEATSGRGRTRYVVNPKIVMAPARELTKPTKAPSVGFVSAVAQDEAVLVASGGREWGEL